MKKKAGFQRKHWIVIVICFFLFYCYSTCTSDGMNAILPRLAEERGWDYAYVLSMASLAGCVSVAGQILFGILCRKIGPVKTIVFALFGASAFMILYGYAPSIPVYIAAFCGLTICASAFSYVGGSALLSNWFPAKNGVAMGYATMGTPTSTATAVTALSFLFGLLGFMPTMMVMAGILAILAIASTLLIRSTPEECGEYPDGIKPAKGSDDKTCITDNICMSMKEMLHRREV